MASSAPFTVGGIEQAYLVTCRVDGQDLGVWDTFSGGGPTTKTNMHRPGGMGEQVIYTSLPTYADVKVGRVLNDDRDWELSRRLATKCGRVRCSATVQPLDADGNAYGKSKTYSGILASLDDGKVDSTSEANKMLELTFGINLVA
jgi:hypothetical protein